VVHPDAPRGLGSVMAAADASAEAAQPAPPPSPASVRPVKPATVLKPAVAVSTDPYADQVNAFTEPPPPPPADNGNAFPNPPRGAAMGPAMGPRPGMPMVMYPPMQPQMPMAMQMPAMDSGVPAGLANAFTTAGTPRPIPENFGQRAYVPNAFTDQGAGMMGPQMAMAYPPPMAYYPPPMMAARPMYAPPMAYRPAPAPPPQPAASPTETASVPQLVGILKEALYPSHREQAADRLGSAENRTQREVVDALVLGAKEDPAATVRAACVRALTRMKADGPAVAAALRELSKDGDERVRREVEQSPLAGRLDTAVTPTSGTQPPK
jgi:hypothetical protein